MNRLPTIRQIWAFGLLQQRPRQSFLCRLSRFSTRLSAEFVCERRGGFQYTENYNDPLSSPSTESLCGHVGNLHLCPGSYAQVGFTESQNATDVITPDAQRAYYAIRAKFHGLCFHQPLFDIRSLGIVIGRWQHSTYTEGLYDNESCDHDSVGVDFSYNFTPHFSCDAGYNYDDVHSQVPGNNYTRNRVYLGVSASY